MAIQAKTRLTFHQLVDGTTLNFTLSASEGYTQIKSKDPVSFHPNYPTNNNIIRPYLSVQGKDGNQVKGACNWFVNGSPVVSGQNGFVVRSSGDYGLEIKSNQAQAVTRIRCEYRYVDTATGLSTLVSAETTLNVTENAGTIIMATVRPMTTDIFKTRGTNKQELSFEATMVRGGAPDTSDVTYEWHILGTNGQFHKITNGNAPSGSGLPGGTLFKNVSSRVITITSDAVLNISTLKVVCRDKDAASSTYNKTAEAYQSIIDLTDPYRLVAYAKESTNISRGNSSGNPVELFITQGEREWEQSDYNNKTLGFYRLTAADAKDATFSPAGGDFPGWTVANNQVTRAFASNNATAANRTISIKNTHLHAAAAKGTTFEFFIEW